MPLTDLVAPNAIVPALKVNGKKQAIQELSSRAAKLTGQNERLIFETLMQREKLGSTGVGNGIAIPHGKLPKLEKLVGLFARLDRLRPHDRTSAVSTPSPTGLYWFDRSKCVSRLLFRQSSSLYMRR